MRLAYNTVATAAIASVLIVIMMFSGRPASATVAAALGLDAPEAGTLDRRRAEAVAALTATCMHAKGWPYVPIAEPPPPVPDGGLDPVAWAGLWGFGISTSIGAPLEPPLFDPNAVLASRFPKDGRAAYELALHGTAGRPGCRTRSTREVMDLRPRAMEPLRDELQALNATIDADPAIATVNVAWARCVAPLGVPSPERSTLSVRLMDRVAAELDAVDSATELARVQADERRIAELAARCEATYVAGRARVAEPHERAFVARFRTELERIGASIRAAEAAWPTIPP